MSTTTESVGVVKPVRELIIMDGPRTDYFMGCISANLLCHGFTFTFHMNKELPSEIKPQAQNRLKFHLRILLAGDGSKTPHDGGFRIIGILQDTDHTTNVDPPRTVNYFYAGVYNCQSFRGFVDEYNGNGFIENPLIRSLYPDRYEVFRNLVRRR